MKKHLICFLAGLIPIASLILFSVLLIPPLINVIIFAILYWVGAVYVGKKLLSGKDLTNSILYGIAPFLLTIIFNDFLGWSADINGELIFSISAAAFCFITITLTYSFAMEE